MSGLPLIFIGNSYHNEHQDMSNISWRKAVSYIYGQILGGQNNEVDVMVESIERMYRGEYKSKLPLDHNKKVSDKKKIVELFDSYIGASNSEVEYLDIISFNSLHIINCCIDKQFKRNATRIEYLNSKKTSNETKSLKFNFYEKQSNEGNFSPFSADLKKNIDIVGEFIQKKEIKKAIFIGFNSMDLFDRWIVDFFVANEKFTEFNKGVIFLNDKSSFFYEHFFHMTYNIDDLMGICKKMKSKGLYEFLEIQGKENKVVRTYARRRCRVCPSGSKPFTKSMQSLLSENNSLENIDTLSKEIQKIKDKYEQSLAYAAFYEVQGEAEKMVRILSETIAPPLTEKEYVRRLYRAIGYEKLQQISKAKHDLFYILGCCHSKELRIAAMFNLQICFQKKGEYEKVNFEKFIDAAGELGYKDVSFVGGENIIDKALNMHLIVCIAHDIPFVYTDMLKESLERQYETNQRGYTKSLINYFNYKKDVIDNDEITELLKIVKKMDVNSKVTILIKLSSYLDFEKHKSLFEEIYTIVYNHYKKSKSETVRKYFTEFEAKNIYNFLSTKSSIFQ